MNVVNVVEGGSERWVVRGAMGSENADRELIVLVCKDALAECITQHKQQLSIEYM